MTVSSTTNRVAYTGNGTANPLAVAFPFQATTDLVVVETVIATGVSTTKVITTDYTVTGTPDASGFYPNGGNVVPTAVIAATKTWTIYRDPVVTQLVQHVDNDPLPAASIDNPLDKLTQIAQRLKEIGIRSIRAPEGDAVGTDMVAPGKLSRLGKVLAFDSTTGLPVVSTLTLAYLEAGAALANVLAAGATATAIVYLQVSAYKLVADGATNDGPALQRCATAAAALGYRVAIPSTGLRIETQAILPDNTVLEGGGRNCVITGAIDSFLIATSISRLTLRNLGITVTNNAYYPDFRAVDQLIVENVSSTAFVDGTTGLTAFGLRIRGCANVVIDNCRFINSNDAVYLEAYSAVNCGTVIVTRSWFEHTLHGNFFSYPAQVYQLYCDNLIVDNCNFVNIFPGNLVNPSPIGYAVYEGDGAAKSTFVTNCKYRTTENRTDTAFCFTSTASDIFVGRNNAVAEHATGGGYLYRGTAVGKALHITDNVGRGFGILAAESGASETIVIDNNDIISNVGLFSAIRVGVSTATAVHTIVTNNRVRNSLYGGIAIFAGTWFDVSGNQLLDCNTSNTARTGGNEHKSSCIVISGQSGRVSRNRMRNTGTGHAKYGIDLVDAVNTTLVTIDNSFSGMETGDAINNVYLCASGTVDPSNLADGAGQTITIACSGAVLGDFVMPSFSLDLQGITATAWVSSADNVSVRLQNESGGAIDLASGTLRARVVKKI